MKILITGCAGFIGYHLSERLIKLNEDLFGIDNINDYYDTHLKKDRLLQLGISISESFEMNRTYQSKTHSNFRFQKIDIEDLPSMYELFKYNDFDLIINLAAQVGVRSSLSNPFSYLKTNIIGFVNILESIKHRCSSTYLIYASSSSVYGNGTEIPFSENQKISKPLNLYAVTKATNELMAYAYHNLYGLKSIGLRFFTVYGPWGRPDMSYYHFAKALIENKSIKIFNKGEMYRDFTYISDIIDGICKCIEQISIITLPDILNIGNNKTENLLDFINLIASELNISEPNYEFVELQKGDAITTFADVEKINKVTGYQPSTDIKTGIPLFINWFKEYHQIINP
jgi:UDP-glucuronate 4-epimerase